MEDAQIGCFVNSIACKSQSSFGRRRNICSHWRRLKAGRRNVSVEGKADAGPERRDKHRVMGSGRPLGSERWLTRRRRRQQRGTSVRHRRHSRGNKAVRAGTGVLPSRMAQHQLLLREPPQSNHAAHPPILARRAPPASPMGSSAARASLVARQTQSRPKGWEQWSTPRQSATPTARTTAAAC